MILNPVGYTPQSSATVLANVQTAYTNTFGDGFILSPSSINGQMIQFNTESAIEVEDAKTLLYGSLYNPYLSFGVWLESICKFNNIKKKPATASVIAVVCSGLAGTIIGVNSKIISTSGDIFYNKSVIVIGSGGIGTGQFYSETLGKVPCNAGTVNQIVTTIAGWDTINNPTDGTVGTLQETDYSLRNRRKYGLAINSSGGINSIISALNELTSVKAFTAQENYTRGTINIQGVAVEPNSYYVAVYCADDALQDVAKVLFTKKSGGAGMQGNTAVIYQDPTHDWVTFTARFERPEVKQIQVYVTIQNSAQYPSNIIALIQQSIVDNFYGDIPTLPAYRITEIVPASRFYFSLTSLGIFTASQITIGIVGGIQSQEVWVPMNQVLELLAENVFVSVV